MVTNHYRVLRALLIDKSTGEIFISQHDGHKVTSFDPLLRTFTDLPIINDSGLPFGMAFDRYGNWWVAEHTINKIAMIDTQKSKIREVTLEISAPFVHGLLQIQLGIYGSLSSEVTLLG